MFMLLECREKDQMIALALKPFPKDIRFIKSEHREAIVRVVIIPYMISSHVPAIVNNTKGRYAACSRDGTVTFWSINMEYKTSKKVILHVYIGVRNVVCFVYGNMEQNVRITFVMRQHICATVCICVGVFVSTLHGDLLQPNVLA